jgi:hypothetical protein
VELLKIIEDSTGIIEDSTDSFKFVRILINSQHSEKFPGIL